MDMFFVIIFCFVNGVVTYSCPIQNSKEQSIIITDFNDLNELNFTNCKQSLQNTSFLEINPKNKIILNNSLNINGLKISIYKDFFAISIINFKGIDYKFNAFKNLKFEKPYPLKKIFWIVESSNFDFYNNNQLINKQKCKLDLINTNDYFFSQIGRLFLKSNVKFSDDTCSLIFHNAYIKLFNIDRLTFTFISKNVLSFTEIKENFFLNSNIFQLIIGLYHFDLTNKLLNEIIFEKLGALDINGKIISIQDDLFKSFKMLKNLRFRTQNAKGLLTRNNKWMDSLNSDIVKQNTNDMTQYEDKAFILTIFQTFSNITYYNYPDKDFCFFKNFPHQRLVVPKLKPNYKSSCSCTELFLIQYSIKFVLNIEYYSAQLLDNYYILDQYYYNDIHEKRYSKCFNSSFEQTIAKCNFKKRLKLCNILKINDKTNEEIVWYVVDWRETSKYLDLIFGVYLNPIFAFICILINILTIKILSSRRIKKEVEFIYIHLKMNNISNIIYTFLSYFDLMVMCISDGLYCPSLSNSLYVLYLNVCLRLVKGSLITFSNITYASFAVNRYFLVSGTKNNYLKKFSKISLKLFLFLALLFSTSINVYTVFEYSAEYSTTSTTLQKSKVENPFDRFITNLSTTQYVIFNVFQYFKIIFSDLLFYISTVIIDVYLIFSIQKSINIAQALVTDPLNNRNILNKMKSNSKIRSMIILNGINYLIFRFPSILIDVYGLFYSLDYRQKNEITYTPDLNSYLICRVFGFCQSLKFIFYFFYLVSFLIQFFIFLKLDSNFKQGFQDLKKKRN